MLEAHLQALIDGFCEFASAHFNRAGLIVSQDILETALLDRLIKPDFLALILRPDRLQKSAKTLGLNKQPDVLDDPETHREQQLDYLVSRFILNVHASNLEQFELLVSATSGCLVAEVVLDLRHPPAHGESLSGLRIAIDSPLILDALGLGLDGAAPYAKQLIKQVRNVGATPCVFDCTTEEIQSVLRAPLQHYERGQELHGPLGRKLRNSFAFAAYLRSVIPKIPELIRELGIEAFSISGVDRAQRLRFFTEPNEAALASHLGEYPTDEARLHDARAISDVLRIRSHKKGTSIRESEIVFVTRNSRLARLSKKYLIESSLASEDYLPPCITDRYLAGVLWIVAGGGADSLSRLRLVANCSTAIVPRREIVSRMHKFFEDLNPAMVTRFEALMTNERAEHFLMDRAIADASLITPENFEDIYKEIEEVAAERVTEKMTQKIADLQTTHATQIEAITAQMEATAEIQNRRYRDEAVRALQIEKRAQDESERAASLLREKEDMAELLAVRERKAAQACLREGKRAERNAWTLIVGAQEALAICVALMSNQETGARIVIGFLTFVGTILSSVLGSQYCIGNPVEKWISRRRDSAARKYARDNDIEYVLSDFRFDWREGQVTPMLAEKKGEPYVG
jgi:hypothetical protein